VKYRKNLSKSKYLQGLQCTRLLWIAFNQAGRIPPPDAATQFIFDQGHLVGEYAQQLFPQGIKLDTGDIGKNLKVTTECLALRRPVFEAGFSSRRLYCRVDVLNPVGEEEWDIIEVKSTNSVKDEHVFDVNFQRRCCLNAGLKVRNCHIMHLDRSYIKQGEIDPVRLFASEDVTPRLQDIDGNFDLSLEEMFYVIDSMECPGTVIGRHCKEPNTCPLKGECWAQLPKHNVMTLRGSKRLGEELIVRGISNIADIPPDVSLDSRQQIQRSCIDSGTAYVDGQAIRSFLEGLEYPLYFLDFETYSTAIPIHDGSRPHQQIPFQFSLHLVKEKDAEPEHQSYLAAGLYDPRREFMVMLNKVIGSTGSILVYNSAFEKGILKALAEFLPEYYQRIEGILARIVDLKTPFSRFSYYHPDQLGSASLKRVLPAMTGLNYDGLEIADGQTAGPMFLKSVADTTCNEERQKIHEDLINYCSQDTYGMVQILRELMIS